MLIVNSGKSLVQSFGLRLGPGESLRSTSSVVVNRAVNLSYLEFYPETTDELSQLRYKYPHRKFITFTEYQKTKRSAVVDKQYHVVSATKLPDKKSEVSQEVKETKVPQPVTETLSTPVPPTPPQPVRRRRGRPPKNRNITKEVTQDDLDYARILAEREDAKLDAEEKELKSTECK